MIQNITAVLALRNDTSFKFLLLCKRSQLTVLSETLLFEQSTRKSQDRRFLLVNFESGW